MSEAVFNRLVAIIENGTYENASLGAKALREFPDSIDPIAKPVVLILPRSDTGWQKDSGASWWGTTLRYQLSFYIQLAATGNSKKGIADADNLNMLAIKILLSRPQLQLSGQSDIAEIVDIIGLQTTSNLMLPIPYPPANVSSSQGASLYWGFTLDLSIPYRQYITLS